MLPVFGIDPDAWEIPEEPTGITGAIGPAGATATGAPTDGTDPDGP